MKLVVFGDKWGGHPSSLQHLVRELQTRHQVLWVDTVGTRTPRLRLYDLRRGAAALGSWIRGPRHSGDLQAGLEVISPLMYPGFRSGWQRRLNALLLSRAVNRALGQPASEEKRLALTKLPIAADLVGRIKVDRWAYYCVDDLSVWPGLDGAVLAEMERSLVARVDRVIAASEVLQRRIAMLGRPAALLTHGADPEHWAPGGPAKERHRQLVRRWQQGRSGPLLLFWGLVDRRLDAAWCRALVNRIAGATLVLIGPEQEPHDSLRRTPGIVLAGPLPFSELPSIASLAAVLVMPYADLPVTRAMQPLKLKEYLATGKPVVLRELPATRDWADAADLADSAEQLVTAVAERARHGLPTEQATARRRLSTESWGEKAREFERLAGLVPATINDPLR